jgi:hypothetical protein
MLPLQSDENPLSIFQTASFYRSQQSLLAAAKSVPLLRLYLLNPAFKLRVYTSKIDSTFQTEPLSFITFSQHPSNTKRN